MMPVTLAALLADLADQPAPVVELTPAELFWLDWLGSDAYWELLLAQLRERGVMPYGDQ